MGLNYETARKHLDNKFQKISSLKDFNPPSKGWIRAIRDALGMTTSQLAKKMGVAHTRIIAIEKSEILGNLKIDTLERVAEALECQLVYALVPRKELETMAYEQAEKKAKALLKNAEHTMKLENQASEKNDNSELEALIQELLKGSQSRLWDED